MRRRGKSRSEQARASWQEIKARRTLKIARLALVLCLTLIFTIFGCAANELRQPDNFYPNSPGSNPGGSDAAAGDLRLVGNA